MELAAVVAVFDGLDDAGATWWLVGGWGVDALVGHPTRPHRDLDLLVTSGPAAGEVLASLGYRPETDWLPIRLEYAGPAGWVDVHPVSVGPSGDLTQAGPAGTTYDYPAVDLVTGRLGGRAVPSVSAGLQWRAHQGYPAREVDRHDLALLAELLSR